MKFLLVVLAIVVVVSAYKLPTEQDYQNEFVEFMQKYQKTYAAEEFQTRYGIFKRNLDYINEHNTKDLGFSTRMNAFGDLTADEFGKTFNGLRMNNIPMTQLINPEEAAARIQALPTSKDWRTAGAVTAIKNQGQCGSCWSFSATGSTEGAHFLAGNTLVGLSEQNLVDCSTSEGNMGCNGGLMDYAFEYIIKNKGIDTEASYPYQAQGPLTCRFKSADIGATISSYKDVTSGDESKLQEAVNKAPVSVAIDASHSSFQFYSSGVYYEPACSSTQLDHGVLAIGWGVESSKDYWLVKNSWGTDWGLSGYIHMSRNRNNNCGIATTASYPEV